MNETQIAAATAPTSTAVAAADATDVAVVAVGDTTDMSTITTSSVNLDIATGDDGDVEIVLTPEKRKSRWTYIQLLSLQTRFH